MRRFFVVGSSLLVLLGLAVYAFSDNILPAKEALLTFDRIRILPAGIEFRFEDDVVIKFVGSKATVVRLPKLVPAEYTMQLSENVHWYGSEDKSISVRFHTTQRSLSPYSRIFLASKEDPYGRFTPRIYKESVSLIWHAEDEGLGRRYENNYPHPVMKFVALPDVEVPFLRYDCDGWASCIHIGGRDFHFILDIKIRVIEFKS